MDVRVQCEGVTKAGRPCARRARYGEPGGPVRWCSNCDPRQAERRRADGARRHRRFVPARLGEVDPKNVPTMEYIVDELLEAARKVEAGDLEPPAALAISRLLGKAVDALRARAMVGDGPQRTPTDAGLAAAPVDPLSALAEGLDS